MVGLIAVGVVVAVVLVRRRVDRRVLGGAAAAVAVGGGWWLADYSEDHRFRDAGLFLDSANEFFRDVSDSRVGLFGSNESYPLFGVDLSNDVTTDADDPEGEEMPVEECRRRRAEMGNTFDYVVLTAYGFGRGEFPAEAWIAEDPAARLKLRDGVTSVWRIAGPLDPSGGLDAAPLLP